MFLLSRTNGGSEAVATILPGLTNSDLLATATPKGLRAFVEGIYMEGERKRAVAHRMMRGSAAGRQEQVARLRQGDS